jgi:hypothetical protein
VTVLASLLGLSGAAPHFGESKVSNPLVDSTVDLIVVVNCRLQATHLSRCLYVKRLTGLTEGLSALANE